MVFIGRISAFKVYEGFKEKSVGKGEQDMAYSHTIFAVLSRYLRVAQDALCDT